MTKTNQTTIQHEFSLAGKGLHTGQYVTATICPAPVDNGIKFIRTDLQPAVTIPADAKYAGDCTRGSVITYQGVTIATMEHLLSALHGLQIDNINIMIDGPEVPILDGSAKLWVEKLLQVGIDLQDAPRKEQYISEPIEFVSESGSKYTITPADHFSVECEVDFGNTIIGRQTATLNNLEEYVSEIASCRTFVFLHDVLPLLQMGYIKGGDLDNALVFVNQDLDAATKQNLANLFGRNPEDIAVRNGLLNTVDQYFENEPARHKLLDFVGDILLFGAPICAHFKIQCPGHKSNLALAHHLQTIIK